MIQITSVNPDTIKSNFVYVEFILFSKIVCNCSFKDNGFQSWVEIKEFIEKQLTEDFTK